MKGLLTYNELKARGWTKKMIVDLIRPTRVPQHDGKYEKFYRLDQVNKIETTKRYKEYRSKADEVINESAVATCLGKELTITCDKLSLDELFTKASRASVEDSYYNEFLSIISKDKMITNEFLVNYLVNEHTNLNTFQKYNKNTKRVIIDRIFMELKQFYPTLKKELDNEYTLRKNRCK